MLLSYGIVLCSSLDRLLVIRLVPCSSSLCPKTPVLSVLCEVVCVMLTTRPVVLRLLALRSSYYLLWPFMLVSVLTSPLWTVVARLVPLVLSRWCVLFLKQC